MTNTDFDKETLDAARMLAIRSAAVISELLENPEARTISDAVRVYEAANKRLGLYQNEKAQNLPLIQWTITGGNVTIGMTPAAADAAPSVELVQDVTDVTPVQDEPPATFLLDLGGIESMTGLDL